MNWLKTPSTTGGIVYLVVLATLLVGLVMVTAGAWRTGVVIIGAGFGLAFAARAVLPEDRAGMLRVRRRFVDLSTLAVCCAGILTLAVLIPGRG